MIKTAIRRRFHAVVGWWNCRQQRHDWEMTLDEPGKGGDISEWWGGDSGPCFLKGLPSRHCIFTCRRCGAKQEFNRWAFVQGSGALHYFFGRYWPITYRANAHALAEERSDDSQKRVVGGGSER